MFFRIKILTLLKLKNRGVGFLLKSTGVIRKIDELGRIVLPKEIRRNLGIRDGENLEIFVENDSILLKKYSKMQDYSEIVKNLASVVDNTYNFKIIITDRDKVLYSGVNKIKNNQEIGEKLIKYIHNRESVSKSVLDTYNFKGEDLTGYFLILPIISSIDCLGLILFYQESGPIPEYHFDLLKLLANIIIGKIDIA